MSFEIEPHPEIAGLHLQRTRDFGLVLFDFEPRQVSGRPTKMKGPLSIPAGMN
jgi:hypothetical protein